MTKPSISRRDFLKAAGLSLGAAAVACSGLGYAAVQAPAFDTSNASFGKENPVNQKILVAYATRAGSTVEIAKAIGEALGQRGYTAEVKAVKEKPALAGYQAVVLGSAIRMGNWLPEMTDFIKTNQPVLKTLPTAIFTVHMLNTGEDAESRAKRTAYTTPISQLLTPAAEAFFWGKMDYSTLSFFDRIVAQAVEKQTGSPTGDHRDWNQIRGWAETLFV